MATHVNDLGAPSLAAISPLESTEIDELEPIPAGWPVLTMTAPRVTPEILAALERDEPFSVVVERPVGPGRSAPEALVALVAHELRRLRGCTSGAAHRSVPRRRGAWEDVAAELLVELLVDEADAVRAALAQAERRRILDPGASPARVRVA